jgi:hypothetical protein
MRFLSATAALRSASASALSAEASSRSLRPRLPGRHSQLCSLPGVAMIVFSLANCGLALQAHLLRISFFFPRGGQRSLGGGKCGFGLSPPTSAPPNETSNCALRSLSCCERAMKLARFGRPKQCLVHLPLAVTNDPYWPTPLIKLSFSALGLRCLAPSSRGNGIVRPARPADRHRSPPARMERGSLGGVDHGDASARIKRFSALRRCF